MSVIKKIFLAILSLLLIIDINLIVLAISANETILNPEFAEYEFGKFGAYSKIRENILNSFGGDAVFTGIINDSVTDDWIKEQSHGVIYGFFDYIKSKGNRINLTISTIEVKRNIRNNIQRDTAASVYAEYIENEIGNIPDGIDLCDYLDKDTKTKFKNFQSAVNYFYLASYLLIAIAAIIPVLSTIVTKNSKSIIRLIGNSAFFSGLISYGTGILTIDMVSQKFQSGEMPDTIPKDIVLAVLGDIFKPMKTYGFLLIIFGAILLILSFFINARKK